MRPDVRAEAARQHEIDFAVRLGFAFLGRREVVAEALILGEVDQPADVAVRVILPCAGSGG